MQYCVVLNTTAPTRTIYLFQPAALNTLIIIHILATESYIYTAITEGCIWNSLTNENIKHQHLQTFYPNSNKNASLTWLFY